MLPLSVRAAIGPALIVASATVAITWALEPLAYDPGNAEFVHVTIALLDPDPLRQKTAMAVIEAQARRGGGTVRPIGAQAIRQALGPGLASDLSGTPIPAMVEVTTTPERARQIAAALRTVKTLDVELDQPSIRRGGWARNRARIVLLLPALAAAAMAGFTLAHRRIAGIVLLHRLGASPSQMMRAAALPLLLAPSTGAIFAAAAIHCSAETGANAGWIAAGTVFAASLAGGASALPGMWRACR